MNRSRLIGLLSLFLLWLPSVCAQAARPWVLLGPEGGDARSLAYDPRNPSRVLLGTSAGELYLSTDSGEQWSRLAHLGEGNDYVLDNIVVDPRDSNVIYVAGWSVENSGGDVFRSRDGGRSWQALTGLHGRSIRALALAPSDPNVIVAGTLDGVFRSRDAGQTWARISPPDHAEIKNIESLAIDPRSPDVIYAGTWHLPWKTEDGGANWHSIKNGILDDSDVFSMIIDPLFPDTVYLSACSGIYKSVDGGTLFEKIQGIPDTARRTRVLQQDPSNVLVVYAGTTEGLFKSLDAGKTWQRMGAANLIVNDVLVDPRRPSRILLATDRSGVLASADGGQTVSPSNRGFAHRQVSSVATDSAGDTLYAGVINDKEFGGVFASRDAGAHWEQMNSGLAGDDVFAVARADSGELLAGTNRGLFLYSPSGADWRPSKVVMTEKVTAATRTIKGKKRTIARREEVRGELAGPVTHVIAASRRWIATTPAGLFVSVDRGAVWRGGGVLGEHRFVGIAMDGDRIAAAAPTALLFSKDGGAAWTAAKLPPYISRLTGVALDPARIWILCREGAYFSTDSGQTWEHVLVGMPAMQIVSIAYDAANRRTLGVASNGEIYSTTNGGAWVLAAEPGRPLRSVMAAGNRLFGITQFNGIVAADAGGMERTTASGTGQAQ